MVMDMYAGLILTSAIAVEPTHATALIVMLVLIAALRT